MKVIIPIFLASLLLVACGNKGDLYIEPDELTAEQQQLLDELEKEKKKKDKSTSESDPESTEQVD